MEQEKENAAKLRRGDGGNSAKWPRNYRGEAGAGTWAKGGGKAQAEARRILEEARDRRPGLPGAQRHAKAPAQGGRTGSGSSEARSGLEAPAERGRGQAGPPERRPRVAPTRPAKGRRHGGAGQNGHPGHCPERHKDGSLQLQAGILKITAKQSEVRGGWRAREPREAQKVIRRAEHKLRSLETSPEVDPGA